MNFQTNPKIYIEKLIFNDYSTLDLLENQILVIVGANNSGKSATLKEILQIAQYEHLPKDSTKVLKHVGFKRKGSVQDLNTFINLNTFTRPEHGNTRLLSLYSESNQNTQRRPVEVPLLLGRWEETGNLMYDYSLFFINHISTLRRLWVSTPAPAISLFQDGPYHPVHFLLEDDEREMIFARYFKQAFNKDLVVNRGPGPNIRLFVGDIPPLENDENKSSSSYIRKLNSLPTLEYQGDGMKGFVGVMLSAFTSIQPLLLIDEPEAFLHPPQARLLGKMLGKDIPSDKQIIIATHSEDILKGLIDANSDRLKIIRLERRENINYVTTLDHKDIKLLWGDPILRYSNILSGLFHSKVVLCEGDADCRFYSAINETFSQDEGENSNIFSSDILFVHCGGKDKMHIVVKALKKLGVPIVVAADIDILRTEGDLKKLVEAFNGNWDQIKSEYKTFQISIDKQKVEKDLLAAKTEINKVLDESTNSNLSNSDIESIHTILKKATPWDTLKRAGKANLQRGDEYKAFESVVGYLVSIGLHVVEVGELECFVKSVGNKGPKWVNQVLTEKDFKTDQELNEAKDFVRKLVK